MVSESDIHASQKRAQIAEAFTLLSAHGDLTVRFGAFCALCSYYILNAENTKKSPCPSRKHIAHMRAIPKMYWLDT